MTVVFHRLSLLIFCLLDHYVRAQIESYIIYPVAGLLPHESSQVTRKIENLAVPGGKVYTSWGRRYSEEVSFWCADLPEPAYNELHNDPKVRATEHVFDATNNRCKIADIHPNKVVMGPFIKNESLETNGTYLFRPTSGMTRSNLSASEQNFGYVIQKLPEATELRVLSQPPANDPISRYPNYVYIFGGKETYIYHVELGINEQHDDFRNIRGRNIQWLWTGLAYFRGADTRDEAAAGGGHSTCTASKAVGNRYGASKRATLVVVKMPSYEEASVAEVLDTVIVNIQNKQRTTTSVVNISWGSKVPVNSRSLTTLEKRLETQIEELLEMGVTVVCAAGNKAQSLDDRGRRRLEVDTIPAVLYSWDYLRAFYEDQFFVIGNSDINGERYRESQITSGSEPQLYAPGVGIKCASSTSLTGDGGRKWTGTSFCKSPLSNLWFLADRSITSRTSCSWCHRRSNFHGTISVRSWVLVAKNRWPIRGLEFS